MKTVTRKSALDSELKRLANWALIRSVGEHDINTTLTMLARKAEEIRKRVGEVKEEAR